MNGHPFNQPDQGACLPAVDFWWRRLPAEKLEIRVVLEQNELQLARLACSGLMVSIGKSLANSQCAETISYYHLVTCMQLHSALRIENCTLLLQHDLYRFDFLQLL